MGQSTSHPEQAEPEQGEQLVPESINQSTSADLDRLGWLSLDDEEEVVWEGSPSFKSVVSSLLVSFVIVAIGVLLILIKELRLLDTLTPNIQVAVVAIGGLAIAIGLGFFLFSYWSYRRRRYVITTEATYRRWRNSTLRIGMEDICSASTERYSWLDRPFSCGDLKIHWLENGREKTTYPAVPNPKQVQQILMEIVLEKQNKEMGVSEGPESGNGIK